MDEALKEVWRVRFEKAKAREFNIREMDLAREVELLKLKIDLCLDAGNKRDFERYSKQLQSIKSFLVLKGECNK